MARTHLVWDWNGTLLDDLSLVVSSSNHTFASVGGRSVDSDEHRQRFRRPVSDFYAEILERAITEEEFEELDRIFHEAYRMGLTTIPLVADAEAAIKSWSGTQSLLSMWFHDELIPAVESRGLAGVFARIDGRPTEIDGGLKAGHLARHLAELGIGGEQAVLIGDSIDDADAAASVGARCVLYSGGFTDPARLRASGTPVADTLLDAVALAKSL
ncbi:HAD family hydrolase [Couchioplanes caeruleus]|uniref:Hydrolase n=2 Tax=Couchioplanes caeruleus TaxID=56438 RepID=A0A1K0FAA1_9ACTN|nr:HAD hydrolase-like protein [Couchioplanes caeruleus]OJF09769.1 hydrolase [Couchioplanes caeruleus subsp. caeruleus]ROP31774.1 phosphoglycolate phosphatase-like HAD superfamily hydrolase [Couchioplanes caeruleus]